MNWNYWLPWRSYPDDGNDSSYEERVKDRCDHDFKQSTELMGYPRFEEAQIEEGYLVIPQYELVDEFCTKCGAAGIDGNPDPYNENYLTVGGELSGEWSRIAHKLAFKPDMVLDPGLSVADALTEPEEPDDGDNRVIINRDQQDEDDAPLVPITD